MRSCVNDGRVDLFLRSTVGVAQERVGEEPSAHVVGLSRWRLPLFPVVESPVVGQDASSRRWGRLEQQPTQSQTSVLGGSHAGRGRVGDQGVHDVRQWVQHLEFPDHFRRFEVSPVDARRLGGVSRGQHAGRPSSSVAVGLRPVRGGRRASSRESTGAERVARALVGGETQSVARQCLYRRRDGPVEPDPPVTTGPRTPLVAATP